MAPSQANFDPADRHVSVQTEFTFKRAFTRSVLPDRRGRGVVGFPSNRVANHGPLVSLQDFTKAFTEKVKQFQVGHGFDQGITHGPLIHDRAVSKVQAHVDDAVQNGGKVLAGGKMLPELGPNFYAPTVIRDMTSKMKISSEETFGPVAALFPFETEKEVVELANAAEVGLAGYFFSKDIQRCYRVAEHLQCGMIGINTGLISDPASPFGGVKDSGFGREGSKYGIDEYLIIKTMTLGGVGELQG